MFRYIKTDSPNRIVSAESTEEQVIILIIRDLRRLKWKVRNIKNKIEINPPKSYDKEVIRKSMAVKRDEIINNNRDWIDTNIHLARANLAYGSDALKYNIKPIIEVCETPEQHRLFRIFRYHWSSPHSEYVGRRIKLIIRDASLPDNPVIGIAALGSPIFHMPERDKYIGWNLAVRQKNINYMMDAYVIGALPPYNYLLGGKLISYLLTSTEVRKIFSKKYSLSKYTKCAGLFTTSLYGRSSQYNRLKFNDRLLYKPIGETKGYGTLHITNETFNAMNDLLKENNIIISNVFGEGPSWRMRVIKHAATLLGFDPNTLLMHSFQRKIYYIPFAKNSTKFLNGQNKNLLYYKEDINSLTSFWRERWYNQRKENSKIITEVNEFTPDSFEIKPYLPHKKVNNRSNDKKVA